MKAFFKVVLSIATLWLPCVSASAQQEAQPSSLTLQQAVTIALEKNPLRKAAIADTKVASAGVRAARSFLMPHLSFSETATRGDDPVYVFGSKLRQQRFTTGRLRTEQAEHASALRQLRHAVWGDLEPVRFVRQLGTASIRQNR